jgi:DNA helicase HerA-like ATPase
MANEAVFNFDGKEPIGRVQSVDTSTVVIHVINSDKLSKVQVNHMVVLRSSKLNQWLIGLVNKIMRKYGDDSDLAEGEEIATSDIIKVTLIGTFLEKDGIHENVFKRTLESVPEIDADCFIMTEDIITGFMSIISNSNASVDNPLCIGNYVLNGEAKAYLDGNKLFQRHAVIAGSTGSGKSYTVATLIEQIAKLKSANALVFDIHGEYKPITGDGINHFKIAGPSDATGEGIIHLPYWLLTYEEMLSMMLDRSDNNAPNQAMIFSRTVLEKKKEHLISKEKTELSEIITIDSPTPYNMNLLKDKLEEINNEIVPGAKAGTTKAGDFNGKLSRFIQRLEAKIQDKRLNFIFSKEDELLEYNYINALCKNLITPTSNGGGVKIIDFSEVPSDILPLIVSLIARIVFSVQQWTDKDKINPIALFCDEAHLYIPIDAKQGVEMSSLNSFERIAKEGRKYGVGLVVITQRPSEVNRTVLSQSNNFIAMRLTNADDQSVVKKLMPDSIGNFAELLPVLDIGEALVVGDASLLPSRIKVKEPEKKPNSNTIKFWDVWSKDDSNDTIDEAIEALRKQTK